MSKDEVRWATPALLPIPDVSKEHSLGPLLTQSGHWNDSPTRGKRPRRPAYYTIATTVLLIDSPRC